MPKIIRENMARSDRATIEKMIYICLKFHNNNLVPLLNSYHHTHTNATTIEITNNRFRGFKMIYVIFPIEVCLMSKKLIHFAFISNTHKTPQICQWIGPNLVLTPNFSWISDFSLYFELWIQTLGGSSKKSHLYCVRGSIYSPSLLWGTPSEWNAIYKSRRNIYYA